MRRCAAVAATVVAALTLTAAPASAQFFVGVGLTQPSGDFGEYAKAGWMVNAGARVWRSANERMSLYAEGFYGSNSHDDVDGDKTNLYGGLASIGYGIGGDEGSIQPYLLGSLGYMVHQYKSDAFPDFEGSEGGVAFGAGGGVGFKKFWVDARYMSASIEDATTAFILISAGVSF